MEIHWNIMPIEDKAVIPVSKFFTAKNENYANEIMDKLGKCYVVSDIEMATGKFYAITTGARDSEASDGYWTQIRTPQGNQQVPSMKYYNSMVAQLHILDAIKLNHYRLVHESEKGSYGMAEIGYKQVYNYLSNESIETVQTGYVKIFEYVPSAKIIGSAPKNAQDLNPNRRLGSKSRVELSTTIKTNTGRTFLWNRTAIANENGTYEFVVPYSTEGQLPKKPYTITFGKFKSLVIQELQDGNFCRNLSSLLQY